MTAHTCFAVGKSRFEHVVVELCKPVERVKGVDGCARAIRWQGDFGRSIIRMRGALEQQPSGSLAAPKTRAANFAGQRVIAEFAHVGGLRLGHVVVHEPPNAAVVLAVVKAVLLLQVAGYRRVVLDDFAIKIGDVNAAVWTHGKVDWMKPNVSRCDKLRLRFARCSPNVEKDAVTLQFGTMNKVLCRGTGEDLSAQAGQGGVDINERRTGGGEVAVRDRLGSTVAVPIIFAETWVVGALGTPRVRFADGERRIVIRTVTA